MALGLRAVDNIPLERAGAEALRRRRPELEPSPAPVIADGGERTQPRLLPDEADVDVERD